MDYSSGSFNSVCSADMGTQLVVVVEYQMHTFPSTILDELSHTRSGRNIYHIKQFHVQFDPT